MEVAPIGSWNISVESWIRAFAMASELKQLQWNSPISCHQASQAHLVKQNSPDWVYHDNIDMTHQILVTVVRHVTCVAISGAHYFIWKTESKHALPPAAISIVVSHTNTYMFHLHVTFPYEPTMLDAIPLRNLSATWDALANSKDRRYGEIGSLLQTHSCWTRFCSAPSFNVKFRWLIQDLGYV